MTTTPNDPREDENDRDDAVDQPTTTTAEDVTSDGPLDADEGDPPLDSYPG